jgi:hypothetical protein
MTYNAATMELEGSAQALTICSPSFGGSGVVRLSRDSQISYDLNVGHDSSFLGNGGGFELTGTASLNGTTLSGILLQGTITNFGAEPPTPGTWESNFEIAPTGGLLSRSYTGADGTTQSAPFPEGGPNLGMEVFAEQTTSGTPGDFSVSFSDANDKFVFDTLSISEPSSGLIAVIALVILGLLGFARKRTAPAA